MAALFADFPEDEKRDSVTFSVAHTIVMIKMFSIIVNKKNIKKLISDIIAVCESHEEESLMNEKYKVMKINVIAYFFTCYSSAACFVFEGLRKMYEGNHFVTVVTYYPAFEDNSAMATATRFITTIILFIMLMAMIISVDGFTMVILIMFKYKLITLRNYFDKLRKDTEILHQSSDPQLAVNHLVNGLIKGIIMHKELLRILKEIDKAFGTVVALQLCQSSGGAVSLLLGIALSDQLTLVAIMKIIFFVVALFFLLGLFLCNAGEITYQASLLSESIFYCGWHTCSLENSRGRNIRRIVLHACIQAQRPLVMKAFKMIELTYGTFLWVLRGTYSVFALFYAQNK
ncbi:olfactory receptor 22 [Danaus plexippus plexippus]|uniref:Odorant receptor n=1 Tax=Danaus plexippus plexippus TaxID=278856 RepID=A0A212ERC0_DANPL|nr:olfactory receptor 22 [Danaus plexippus plexippus]